MMTLLELLLSAQHLMITLRPWPAQYGEGKGGSTSSIIHL